MEQTEYQVKIEAFEGPLDLLLHLISKAEIDIKDIFLSEITQQYLEYIQQMEEADMEVASEFLTMAATLMYIKSRALLPTDEDDEEIDEEKMLIEQLEEYRRMKLVSEQLQEMETGAQGNYYKLPEEYIFEDDPLNLEGIGVVDLFSALQELLEEIEEKAVQQPVVNIIKQERFSVRERIAVISRRLQSGKPISFAALFEKDATRNEVVTTFVALLEMITAGKAIVRQKSKFAEILISGQVEASS